METPLLKAESKGDTSDEITGKWKTTLAGVLCSFISGLLLLGNNTIVKKMELDFADALFGKGAGLLIISFVFQRRRKDNHLWIWEVDENENITKIRWIWIYFTVNSGILNAVDILAISFLPIGDAMTIILSSVLPTIIISAIFLNERLRLYKTICGALIMVGLVLIVRPAFLFSTDPIDDLEVSNQTNAESSSETNYYNYYLGLISSFTCMICMAVTRILTKRLLRNKSTSSPYMLAMYAGIGCIITSLILPVFGGNQRIVFPSGQVEQYDALSWVGMSVFAILGVPKILLRFMSIDLVGPIIESFVLATEIVLSYLVQILYFGDVPYLSTVVGAICVILSCGTIIFEEDVVTMMPTKLQQIF